ncbi:Protein of unknown function [Chitinophaga sp. YR627]|uniref:YgaP family membrane protein n=1 Tax=Chitinophaga sp. YR627 TaxID=1881041 RepID=UPI0008E0EB91|nr:DUF2892 domain-containing protein [Chitinophaga sp. YR627]SFM71033.1 Protein of unknown function [Chitinophaga sp. YR627]
MKKNEGMFDRILRATLALTAFFIYYNKLVTGTGGIILLIIAAVLAITSLIGICPLYTALGISTEKQHKTSAGAHPRD